MMTMKYRYSKLFNWISAVCFFISSFSIVIIPFSSDIDKITFWGYIAAGVFWGGLLMGIASQIILNRLYKDSKKHTNVFNKVSIILSAVFLLAFIFILIFLRKNIILLSIDMALMIYFFE